MDVLIFGHTQEVHDSRLLEVRKRLAKAGVTLKQSNCVFSQKSIKFLGHKIEELGVQADPEKLAAITHFHKPQNAKELRRFMDMANHLGKLTPHLADIDQPFRQLLSTKQSWYWGPHQHEAFAKVPDQSLWLCTTHRRS